MTDSHDDTNDNSTILAFLEEEYEKKEYAVIVEFIDAEMHSSDELRDDRAVMTLLAMSNFNLENYLKASDAFEILTEGSENPDDWFNLSTSAIMCGQVDKGIAAFDEAIETFKTNGTKENLTPGMMTYYVMCALRDVGEHDRAFIQMDKLGKSFMQLKITDPTFLTVRGLPFFTTVLEEGIVILENQDAQTTQQWLHQIYVNVDDEGQSFVKEIHRRIFGESAG